MAKYMLYVTREGDDNNTQVMIAGYDTAWKTKKLLDELLKGDTFEWIDGGPGCVPDTTIRSSSGIVVSTRWYPERMRAIVEHEYEPKHELWDFAEHEPEWARAARFFRTGEQPRTLEEDQRAKTNRREPRASSAPRTAHPAGYVHVSDVALSMGIDAKQARVALRKLFDEKPAYGWWFDPATLDDLKTKIRGAIK